MEHMSVWVKTKNDEQDYGRGRGGLGTECRGMWLEKYKLSMLRSLFVSVFLLWVDG